MQPSWTFLLILVDLVQDHDHGNRRSLRTFRKFYQTLFGRTDLDSNVCALTLLSLFGLGFW